jgi:hypothetical protein
MSAATKLPAEAMRNAPMRNTGRSESIAPRIPIVSANPPMATKITKPGMT